MNQKHPWHTSAYQETGFESVLLSTRLRALSQSSTTTLDHLAAALGGGEGRKIAQLSFEVEGGTRATKHTNGHTGEGDERAPTRTDTDHDRCDLFPDALSTTDPRQQRSRKFAEIYCSRGDVASDDAEGTGVNNDNRDRHEDFRRLE